MSGHAAERPSAWLARAARRRLRFGLATLLGWRPRGFFIPYRYAASVPGPGDRPPYSLIAETLRRREPLFRRLLGILEGYAADLLAIAETAPPPNPRWRQTWFPRLDAAIAYTLVRRLRPRRLIEVGAGHSTRFFARAVADGHLDTKISAIDPAPRATLAELPVDVIPSTVQAAGPSAFARLAAGDMLSIDSSHVLMPGSDADLLINHVLPALPVGAVVHIHDIFLPDDYPADWAWRGYNEQLAVAALLQGAQWRPLWASRYVVSRCPAWLDGSVISRLPLPEGAHEASLWLRKTGVRGATPVCRTESFGEDQE